MVYVRKNIRGFYITLNEPVDPEYYAGQIGESYEDFLDNKWVLLSEEQVTFHLNNPGASVREVIAIELDNAHDPILEAKNRKLFQLSSYDKGSNINDFTVNGEIHDWFTPEQRSNYRNSIDAAKLLGVNELSVFIGNTLVQIPTTNAEQMLAAIQLYADQCYIVTKQHKAAIEALNSVEDIHNYDFTAGYPTKLNFTLQ